MSKPFDPSKPCKMRGFPDKVRIVCTDVNMYPGGCKGPILALATDPVNGYEYEIYRSADGTYRHNDSQRDLVNIPERVEKFINIYPNSIGALCSSKFLSDSKQSGKRDGQVKFIYEDDVLVGCELVEKSDA